jgi:hypothetical protein
MTIWNSDLSDTLVFRDPLEAFFPVQHSQPLSLSLSIGRRLLTDALKMDVDMKNKDDMEEKRERERDRDRDFDRDRRDRDGGDRDRDRDRRGSRRGGRDDHWEPDRRNGSDRDVRFASLLFFFVLDAVAN